MNDSNKRHDLRFRTLKRGRIYFNDEQSSLDCQIRDMSATGSKVKIQAFFQLPNAVILELLDSNGPSVFYRCQVAWQRNAEVGLHYEAKIEKAAGGKFISVADPRL